MTATLLAMANKTGLKRLGAHCTADGITQLVSGYETE